MEVLHITGAAPLCTNTFLLLGANGDAMAIDPAASAEEYNKLLTQHNAKLKMIVCTHGHYDHVAAVLKLARQWEVPVYLNTQDCRGSRLFPLTTSDSPLREGDTLTCDDISLQVLATPGHSQGSVCLLGHGLLFSGDTLFAGDAGRTDLDGGSRRELEKSLAHLVALVPNDVRVLPGHGDFSTMAQEKKHNYCLQAL